MLISSKLLLLWQVAGVDLISSADDDDTWLMCTG